MTAAIDEEFAEFLSEAPAKKKPGRPKGSRNKTHRDMQQEMARHTQLSRTSDVFGGVSATFLSQIFRMKLATAKRRLAKCEPMFHKGNPPSPVYDLKDAAAYLVDPKIDIGVYLKTLRPEELPPGLNKDHWYAEKNRQAWLREAGKTWYTEDVLEVFGEVLKKTKSTVQLFQDNIDRIESLSDRQRNALSLSCDGLLEDIYAGLMEVAGENDTPSQAGQISEEGLPIPRGAVENDEV